MKDKDSATFKIDPAAEIGAVKLAVKDLVGMKHFYRDLIGLSLLSEDRESVNLGVQGRLLVRLIAKPDGQSYPYSTGLFHLALLLPSRPELGRWLVHFVERGLRLDGVGDHLVSEALYLSDPEGNGIEIYQDRPRGTWEYQDGKIKMDTLAVDLDSLVDEAADHPFHGLPDATKIGHIHLQVNHLASSAKFYQDVIGFDLTAQMPGAGFLSAGGYHHHVGMNTWRSGGSGYAPADALGLVEYEILLPDKDAKKKLLQNLSAYQVSLESQNGRTHFQDPAGIWISLGLRQ